MTKKIAPPTTKPQKAASISFIFFGISLSQLLVGEQGLRHLAIISQGVDIVPRRMNASTRASQRTFPSLSARFYSRPSIDQSANAVRTSISGYGSRPTDSLGRPSAARTVLKKIENWLLVRCF